MNPTLAMFGLGGPELMLILVVVLILFGAKKIPDFAKGLGQGIKEFRKASHEVQEEIERAGREIETPPPAPAAPAPTPAPAPVAEQSPDPASDNPAGTSDGAAPKEPTA